MVMEEWVNGNWKNAIKYTNTYDGKGNITKVAMDSMDYVNNVWVNSMITSHTLNSNSTINYSITQFWNNDGNKWENVIKTIYTYDGSKNILTEKMQMFLDPDWMDVSTTTNSYNASGLIIKKVSQTSIFGMTINNGQTTYTYNSDGTENQTTFQQWDDSSGGWVNSSRSTNTYNASKAVISLLNEDYTTGAWVNSTKSTITYNANGSVKESLDQDWNVSGSNWVDSSKAIFTYNTNGTINQMLMMDWLADQSKWENASRISYTYNSITFVQPELAETDQLRVFPNPFTDFISIEYNASKLSSIQLFTANGQLIWNFEKGKPLSQINLSSLKNGVYLLKVVSPESQKVVKLLKSNK